MQLIVSKKNRKFVNLTQLWYTPELSLFFPLWSSISDKSLFPLLTCNPASNDIPAPPLQLLARPVKTVMVIMKAFMV